MTEATPRDTRTTPEPVEAVEHRMTAPLEYVESLRRIAQSLNSGLDLRSALQAICDALSDHTDWQLCWVYAMDTLGGFGEIAARRDRMEYTAQSPKERWPFGGNAALEALRKNEIIAIRDARVTTEYPALMESATRRGVIACANIPLSSTDLLGRPMVLCVQSRFALLDDPSQLPFLRAVASLASLAVTNAALLTDARETVARASESAALMTSAIEAITAGTDSLQLLAQIEERSADALVLFDRNDQLYFAGRSPVPAHLSDDDWRQWVLASRDAIIGSARESLAAGANALTLPDPPSLGGTTLPLLGWASQFGHAERRIATALTFSTRSDAGRGHSATAMAAALVVLRDQLGFESHLTLQREVVLQLLDGNTEDELSFAARASFAGIDVTVPLALVAIRTIDDDPEQRQKVGAVMTAQLRNWRDAVVQQVHGLTAVLLPHSSLSDARLSRLVGASTLPVTDAPPRPGVLVTTSRGAVTPSELPAAWTRAAQTIELAHKIGRAGLVGIDELGAYRVLLPSLERRDISEFITSIVGPLLENDRVHNSDLFESVEAFTNLSGRFQETARTLHIHVSTLRYRLQRAESLMGRDLADEETRFEVSLATRLERLRRGAQG